MGEVHFEEYHEATNEHLPVGERLDLLEKEVAFLDRENAELWQIIIDSGYRFSALPAPGAPEYDDAEIID
ncbi:hypothetical protein [Halorussus salinisoli]|uniref:hypothetical protein n=1 Tax=Halorussus salinisoli TaxID=2558242 RepID=UPI0010C1E658|nr:hypothetical protein [Halorussus salinisoli]